MNLIKKLVMYIVTGCLLISCEDSISVWPTGIRNLDISQNENRTELSVEFIDPKVLVTCLDRKSFRRFVMVEFELPVPTGTNIRLEVPFGSGLPYRLESEVLHNCEESFFHWFELPWNYQSGSPLRISLENQPFSQDQVTVGGLLIIANVAKHEIDPKSPIFIPEVALGRQQVRTD